MGIKLRVSAPARADFLNTHQDYKGLPVVSAGLNLRLRVQGEAINGTMVKVNSLDLERMGLPSYDEFDLKEITYRGSGWFGDYVRAVVNILKKAGYYGKLGGVQMTIESDIPIGAGLGSSGALEVTVAKFLDATFNLGLSRQELAEYAYLAEREELGIPCGRLDQYGSAYGGILKIETRPPYRVEELPFRAMTLTVIDSGIKHSTAQIHPVRQREIDEGLAALLETKLPPALYTKLARKHYEVKWGELTEDELAPFLSMMREKSTKRILFTIKMHESTELALRLLRGEQVDAMDILRLSDRDIRHLLPYLGTEKKSYVLLGELMNYQHRLLRDLYELSLPELEKLRTAMLSAGANGVKLSGAGMGGALIALSSSEEEATRVLRAALEAGAPRGRVSGIADGVQVEGL